MEAHLGATPVEFDKAKQIYVSGGHSGGHAQLTVTALTVAVAKGTVVTQGTTATGNVKADAQVGDTTLTVSYASKCKVGGASSPDSAGCFVTTTVLKAGSTDIGQPSAVTNKY